MAGANVDHATAYAEAAQAIAPAEEIIAAARNGEPVIIVDAAERENEGDIVVPAQFATPDVVNFMARHARGLICLALEKERAKHLRLDPMTMNNRSGHGTAFTVSIEAREGVTTGISTHDRAHTVAVAIDPATGAEDLVSPGHVFPLIAAAGGVLVRAGHTEAAVDIARAAGLTPAGVICEVLNDDGSMARLPELTRFAAAHGLKIGTIADLIAFRRRSEKLIERVIERPFQSIYGTGFDIIVYRNIIDDSEHVALVKGRIMEGVETLVRVHQVDMVADLLGWAHAHEDYVKAALTCLGRFDGPAVAVFVRDPDLASVSRRLAGGREHYRDAFSYRDYGIGAQILQDLGVQDMILLSSSMHKLSGLEGFGLSITRRIPRERW